MPRTSCLALSNSGLLYRGQPAGSRPAPPEASSSLPACSPRSLWRCSLRLSLLLAHPAAAFGCSAGVSAAIRGSLAQVLHPRFQHPHHPQVVVVPRRPRVGGVVGPLQVGRAQVAEHAAGLVARPSGSASARSRRRPWRPSSPAWARTSRRAIPGSAQMGILPAARDGTPVHFPARPAAEPTEPSRAPSAAAAAQLSPIKPALHHGRRLAPLVWARIRSISRAEGSGRGVFSISSQAAPRCASASISLQPAHVDTCAVEPRLVRLTPGSRPARPPASPRTRCTAAPSVFPRSFPPLSNSSNWNRFATYTTCPSIRCNSLASSPRPRLIRLFTVPSGIFSTSAISL